MLCLLVEKHIGKSAVRLEPVLTASFSSGGQISWISPISVISVPFTPRMAAA